MKKVCFNCKVELDISMFYVRSSKNNTYDTNCKKCYSIIRRIRKNGVEAENERDAKISKFNVGIKKCTFCKTDKPLLDFSKKGEGRVQSRCKKCVYDIEKKRIKELYNDNSSEGVLKLEKLKATRKKYNDSRAIKYSKYNQVYSKKYYSKNKNKLLNYRKEWINKKRKEDVSFRIRGNISNKIRRNITSNKNASCLKYLPYTIKELKAHLESLFEPWMNWDNWRKI